MQLVKFKLWVHAPGQLKLQPYLLLFTSTITKGITQNIEETRLHLKTITYQEKGIQFRSQIETHEDSMLRSCLCQTESGKICIVSADTCLTSLRYLIVLNIYLEIMKDVCETSGRGEH